MQGLRHLQQHQNGGVAGAVFEIGQMALGDIGGQGHGLARHAPAGSQGPHTLPQRHQKRVALGVVGEASARGRGNGGFQNSGVFHGPTQIRGNPRGACFASKHAL